MGFAKEKTTKEETKISFAATIKKIAQPMVESFSKSFSKSTFRKAKESAWRAMFEENYNIAKESIQQLKDNYEKLNEDEKREIAAYICQGILSKEKERKEIERILDIVLEIKMHEAEDAIAIFIESSKNEKELEDVRMKAVDVLWEVEIIGDKKFWGTLLFDDNREIAKAVAEKMLALPGGADVILEYFSIDGYKTVVDALKRCGKEKLMAFLKFALEKELPAPTGNRKLETEEGLGLVELLRARENVEKTVREIGPQYFSDSWKRFLVNRINETAAPDECHYVKELMERGKRDAIATIMHMDIE